MSQFGVTTAMISLVLAAFMGGLGLGSWLSGHISRRFESRIEFHPLIFYACTEILIGISALVVPLELFSGGRLLQNATLSFAGHYSLAGLWVSMTLVPWCACMGATFPFAMLAIKSSVGGGNEHSFSYLYLANVLGAIAGTTVPLLLIEMFGFRRTLYVGATLNFLLGACAIALALHLAPAANKEIRFEPKKQPLNDKSHAKAQLMWLLFGTGLTSMAAEVVWTRLYTPSVGTLVYAFAAILALYLAATYFGSWLYRWRRNAGASLTSLTWAFLGFTVLLPLLSIDPRLPIPAIIRVSLGIAPLSALVGFVTPKIVDLYSGGDPDLAGKAYAVNIVGCVLGPLLAGFLLLPLAGERWALSLLSLPWFLLGLTPLLPRKQATRRWQAAACCLFVAGAIGILFFAEAFEDQFHPREVLRDSTATVIATGSGFARRLLVNGVGITSLTPITKMMAHLPLTLLSHRPSDVLIICFGMGTSHRSALSWHIHSTAVELVPSVPALFPYFHSTAAVGLDSPLSQIVIDDGRSYLERTREQFDVIVIDPPPPAGAAASSLLYSKEFYSIAKQRLRPGGILQQWFPGDDAMTQASVVRAISESFPYVRAFVSIEHMGLHLLASNDPIPYSTAPELAARLPADAARDLTEWGPASTPEAEFQLVLDQEVSVDKILQSVPNAPALRDDRPVNEFFLIRKLSQPNYWRQALRRLTGSEKLF